MKDIHKEVTGGTYILTYDPVTQQWEISASAKGVLGPFATVRRREGQSIIETEANARAMACAGSMINALWVIANMQVTEHTDVKEVLDLCISIAQIELEKCQNIS